MLKRLALGLLALTLLLPAGLTAQKGHASASHSSTRSSSTSKSSKVSSSKAKTTARSSSHSTKSASSRVSKKSTVAQRNSHGRIKRSAAKRNEFKKQTGYAKGRKGYVVDHIVPLECGGADVPSNMQWQRVQEAKIKDRTEVRCRR
jgi:hypothetical protein